MALYGELIKKKGWARRKTPEVGSRSGISKPPLCLTQNHLIEQKKNNKRNKRIFLVSMKIQNAYF